MTTRTFTSLTISALCALASARASGQAVSLDGDTPAPVVVIDAGHGGSNLGAPGQRAGLFEKRVTLAVAHAVERRLSDAGLGVVMTRGRDEYVTLGERVRRANAAHARLFVSIHANASTDHRRRGVETFLAAHDLNDVQAVRAGVLEDPVAAVEARARVRQTALDSAQLARVLATRLGAARPGNRGVRQASYDVLDGVDVPAALVEVGFLDHAVEGLELDQPEVIERIAAALTDGILDFLHRAPVNGTTLATR